MHENPLRFEFVSRARMFYKKIKSVSKGYLLKEIKNLRDKKKSKTNKNEETKNRTKKEKMNNKTRPVKRAQLSIIKPCQWLCVYIESISY